MFSSDKVRLIKDNKTIFSISHKWAASWDYLSSGLPTRSDTNQKRENKHIKTQKSEKNYAYIQKPYGIIKNYKGQLLW